MVSRGGRGGGCLRDTLQFNDRSMYFGGFRCSCASVEDLKGLYDGMPLVVEKENVCVKVIVIRRQVSQALG